MLHNLTEDGSTAEVGFATSRAQMLVTLLGPDFTKSAKHPFFRRLAEQASSCPSAGSTRDISANSGQLSETLRSLIAHLEKTDSKAIKAADTHDQSKEALKVGQPTDEQRHEIECQHPVLISQSLTALSSVERTTLIRKLPASTARQVLALMSETSG